MFNIARYDKWKTTPPEDQEYIEDKRFSNIRKHNAENHRIAEIKEDMDDEII